MTDKDMSGGGLARLFWAVRACAGMFLFGSKVV
jgi:hypothetical protein